MNTAALDRIVIRNMLERHAEERPAEEFAFFEDGAAWTRADALSAAYRSANRLRAAGVGHGDHVGVFLPNGKDYLAAWWGASVLGAALVPINTAYRGILLGQLINVARPKVLVTNDELGERLDTEGIEVEFTLINARELADGADEAPALTQPLWFGDTELLVLTSGTTGASKLVATSYLHNFLGGEHFVNAHGNGPSERILIDLPMYHSAAVYMVSAALDTGASIAVRSQPSMSAYWEVARDCGVTMVVMVSTMMGFLTNQPPREAEKQHKIHSVLVAPVPPDARGFLDRFGISNMYTTLGSTEIPGPTVAHPDDDLVPGYCGRAREGFAIRVVDANDIEVPAGEAGEFTVRADVPWSMMTEYRNNPEATAKAWRNGWFHTGDMVRMDHEGRIWYVDRVTDSMRRRGENISSVEVEAQIAKHPLVAEVACVPARREGVAEDEVKVFVVPAADADIDELELFIYCSEVLPHFMVPRYIEVVTELPKTASLKVRKVALREQGDGPGCWDSEAHGYRVGRGGVERIGAGSARGE